jgi:hypothetical protein
METDNAAAPSSTTANPAAADANMTTTSGSSNGSKQRPRHILPPLEKYDGKNKTLYPQFESQLQAKLIIDRDAIGGANECVWYAFACLKDEAAAKVHPWMMIHASPATVMNWATLDAFFDNMKLLFQERERRQKALTKLNALRQGNRPFGDLLGEINTLLMEAGGHGWDSAVKCGYLDAAISFDMRTALVGVKKEVVFENYCQQLGVIADQLEELARFAAKGKGRNRSIMPPSYSVANKNSFTPQLQANTRTYRASPAPTTVNSDNMDWQPTVASATSPRRAKLVSKQEMEKRKQQNRCFRCGGSGHRINQCPYLPPKSPAQSPAHVATTHSYEPELEDEESLAEDTRMEGKE